MGRPALDPALHRVQVSVSLKPAVHEMARRAGNMSRFLEVSVETCRDVVQTLDLYDRRSLTRDDTLGRLAVIAGIWERMVEGGLSMTATPYAVSKAKRAFQAHKNHCTKCRDVRGGLDYCPTGYELWRAWTTAAYDAQLGDV